MKPQLAANGKTPGGENIAGTDEQILNSQVANGLAPYGRPAFENARVNQPRGRVRRAGS
jgi:hypothetical protein